MKPARGATRDMVTPLYRAPKEGHLTMTAKISLIIDGQLWIKHPHLSIDDLNPLVANQT